MSSGPRSGAIELMMWWGWLGTDGQKYSRGTYRHLLAFFVGYLSERSTLPEPIANCRVFDEVGGASEIAIAWRAGAGAVRNVVGREFP